MLSHTVYRHPISSDWVTFVHGAGGSSSIWFKQIRAFKAQFNVLVLDLRGHGNSVVLKKAKYSRYTFKAVTNDIVELLDFLKIQKSHFIGISLGTILIRELAEGNRNRVLSMTLAGAIMKLNIRSQVLIKLGVVFKSVIPYMVLYHFFAFIIMPRKNHKKARLLFVKEAQKMCQKEFIRWFRLTSEINPLLRLFRAKDIKLPTFYIMGDQDYLFLPSIVKMTAAHSLTTLTVVENCGHVVNIEQAAVFNKRTINFINTLV